MSSRNYLSDLRKFLSWLNNYLPEHQLSPLPSDPSFVFNYFTLTTLTAYKKHLLDNNLPEKSLNRRLSTLRKFGELGLSQNWLRENPAKKISNLRNEPKNKSKTELEVLLKQYQQDLKGEKIADATIKNYINDVSQFLTWLGAEE